MARSHRYEQDHTVKARRLILQDALGNTVRSMDLTDIDNADTRFRFSVVIQGMCDMGHWHMTDSVELAPWGERVRNE